eukprot:1168285-Amphidinium_carterae.1
MGSKLLREKHELNVLGSLCVTFGRGAVGVGVAKCWRDESSRYIPLSRVLYSYPFMSVLDAKPQMLAFRGAVAMLCVRYPFQEGWTAESLAMNILLVFIFSLCASW